MISNEERKQIIIRLYKLIKESKMFDDHPDARIREAAMNTEQKAFDTSSSVEEYMAFMNSKMEKVIRSNRIEKKEAGNGNGRENGNNFRDNLNRNNSNREPLNSYNNLNRNIRDNNFDRHLVNTGININPLERHPGSGNTRINQNSNQNINLNRMHSLNINNNNINRSNILERSRPGLVPRSNQNMNVPPTMYNTSPKPMSHPYTTPLYNSYNQGQYTSGPQYPPRNVKFINQQQVNSDLQYHNEVNYDIYRRNSIHNNTFMYVNNINEMGNLNRPGDVSSRPGEPLNRFDIFETNRQNDINNIKRQNNIPNINKPDINTNRHDMTRSDMNLNRHEASNINRSEMPGLRQNDMYTNPLRQSISGDISVNQRIRDQNDIVMNKRFRDISRSPDMRRLSGDMVSTPDINITRISQRESSINDNKKNESKRRNEPSIMSKRVQTSSKRTLSSGNIKYQNGNNSPGNILYNAVDNQSIGSPQMSDTTSYQKSTKTVKSPSQEYKQASVKKPQGTQQYSNSNISEGSFLNHPQPKSTLYKGKTVSSQYSCASRSEKSPDHSVQQYQVNPQYTNHDKISNGPIDNQQYVQKTPSPQFIQSPQYIKNTSQSPTKDTSQPPTKDTSQSPSDLKSFMMSTKPLSLSPSDKAILKESLFRDIDIQNKCAELSDKHNLRCDKFNDFIYRLNLQRKLLPYNFFFLTWREVDDMVDYIKRYYIDIKDSSLERDRYINYEESIDNICSMFDSKKNQDNEWLFDLLEE
jgi:hypothetical protein